MSSETTTAGAGVAAALTAGAGAPSGAGEGPGRGSEPSKWPQKPFASTASWNRTEKMAQFKPVASSLGIEEGRESAREVVVKDMVNASASV